MIKFKKITLKNFLSTGNVEQTIDLESSDLTLILGENLDVDRGTTGSRNGCGKTALLQALCYALFGESMNGIRRDNLINRTNARGMLVCLDFSVDDNNYRIERGRKPNVMRLITDNKNTSAKQPGDEIIITTSTDDAAQGENRETQRYIEQITGLTIDMFKIIVCLNTYTTPFLSMRAAEQRTIIEQLLGITLLSERAETLKEQIRVSKEQAAHEELKIQAQQENNRRMQQQIDALVERQRAWHKQHQQDREKLEHTIDKLQAIDIANELEQHALVKAWMANKQVADLAERTLELSKAWAEQQQSDQQALAQALQDLETIDIAKEIQAHENLKIYNASVTASHAQARELRDQQRDLARELKLAEQLSAEITSLENNRCYACNQALHDHAHHEQLATRQQELARVQQNIDSLHSAISVIESNPVFVPSEPQTYYPDLASALRHEHDLAAVQRSIKELAQAVDPYAEQLSSMPQITLGQKPVTFYKLESQAREHEQQLALARQQLASLSVTPDPYQEQIEQMQSTAIQTIDSSVLDSIKSLWDHQKFLLDLLTNRDSFVRKRIVDQSLLFLNSRLSYYL